MVPALVAAEVRKYFEVVGTRCMQACVCYRSSTVAIEKHGGATAHEELITDQTCKWLSIRLFSFSVCWFTLHKLKNCDAGVVHP
jgi:hypothetical protein